MRKGQVSTGLVILGVVAIIAVIGLVLLFTRAGAEAAAIGNTYGAGQAAKGVREYWSQEKGIGVPYPVSSDYYGPYVDYPAPAGQPMYEGAKSTVGTRTPAFVIVGGYASVENMYACNHDLQVSSQIRNPEEQFNCYAVPNKGSAESAVGFFPRASSAYARPGEGYIGKLGGDVYCYATSTGAEAQKPNTESLIRENILTSLVRNNFADADARWNSIMINGIEVPRCWVDADKNYIFPQ